MVIGGAENPYVTEHRRIHPLLSMNVPIYWSVNELFHVCAQDVHLLPSAGQSGELNQPPMVTTFQKATFRFLPCSFNFFLALFNTSMFIKRYFLLKEEKGNMKRN